MWQGNILEHTKVMSNSKQLEYFLLGAETGENGSYAIAVTSLKDNKEHYAVAPQVSNKKEDARRLFKRVVSGTVRPETLHEMLIDLVS